MKILITGGHVTPALAVIDNLKEHNLVFVGRKYALDSEKTISFEHKEVTARNIRFINLPAGRFTRLFSIRSFINALRVPVGFWHAYFIVKNEKPDVILTFGSYLALPIVFWACIFKVRIVVHEQTIEPGLANRCIAWLADKICLSFPESKKYFPASKTVLTGNPVRESIFNVSTKPFTIAKDKPVIFITGGSLGSHSINIHIESILDELLDSFMVIHQTGDTATYDDFSRLEKKQSESYIVQKHFSTDEIGYSYSVADFVICRAGANTFFELIALQKPALFIPLPWSAHQEQLKQAEIFKKAGAGEIFDQTKPSSELLSCIRSMYKNLAEYKSGVNTLYHYYEKDASKAIILQVLQ